MKDEELADELIRRLNELVTEPDVRDFIEQLINRRIPVTQNVKDHPTIQVGMRYGTLSAGFLGLLNGIVGKIEMGPREGWGLVAAVFDDSDPKKLLRFVRTDMADLKSPDGDH